MVLCGGMMTGLAQTNAFVSAAAANDNGDGLTWETAKKTIAAGLTVAGTNGTVFVKAGTYNITAELEIPSGVSMMGGYGLTSSGTDTTQRELPGLNSRWANASICTIINGAGDHRIATVNGLLEGCVLRLGYTNGQGGGTLIDGGTVRYCVIKECDAINESSLTAEGGGAYIRNNGLLSNCVITECRGDKGPAVSGGNGTLINNTITRNWPVSCGTVADYDGNVYSTIIIGQQCWTRENLRTMHYNDGTLIPIGPENSTTEPYRYINYNGITAADLPRYGYLYNWPAVMNGAPASTENPSGVTGICPRGWHLPSDAEFQEMRTFVNTILSYRCSGYDLQIAKSLSSKTRWPSSSGCNAGSNMSTNNRTLFNAYPAGYYDNGFSSLNCANFWTTSQTNGSQVVSYYMNYDNAYLNKDANSNMYRARSVRCVKQLGTMDPVVHTAGISNITSATATCGGTCSDGGTAITARGVCWSTHHDPTTADSHTTDGTGEGSFTSSLTGLTPGDTIFVRAYATNSGGTYYGEERFFVPGDCGTLVFSDYDGNPYGTVQIGDQCWMRENLRTTHYANGMPIPAYSGSTSNTEPYYNGQNNDNLELYGLYYNWPAAMNRATNSDANPSGVQGVCPQGWHLPSSAEWNQLKQFLNSNSEYLCNNTADWDAKALSSQTEWNSYYSSCTPGNNPSTNNATGFNAYPTGYFSGLSCYDRYYRASFWCTSQSDQNYSYYGTIYYGNRNFHMPTTSKYYSLSVRCVKD